MKKKEKPAKREQGVDEGLKVLLRESEQQRAALVEFKEEWKQLAQLHVLLLRDANENSARLRRTAEILEYYRERMAQHYEGVIALVEGERGDSFTPRGTMRFNVDKGWHKNEEAL